MAEITIYLTDQVVLIPGAARAFVESYLNEYAPGAVARGLTLERVLVQPPLWLDDASNTVIATWTVDGAEHWWEAAVAGRYDPEPALWWEQFTDRIVTRDRYISADARDLDRLTDV